MSPLPRPADETRRVRSPRSALVAGLLVLLTLFGLPPALSRIAYSASSYTLFGNTTPQVKASADTRGVELGLKFRSDVNGWVTAVRFYKDSTNAGPHTGSLWRSDGTKLASVNFLTETTSGWQEAKLASPVWITAGALYIVSYYAPNGHFAADQGYFKTAFKSGPLRAPRSGGMYGPNGIFHYGSSAFPTDTYNSTNYWVDVRFAPSSLTSEPVSTTTTSSTTTSTTTSTTSSTTTTAPNSTGFVHPGVVVDRTQLDYVKSKVAAGADPWKSALDKVYNSGGSTKTALRQSSYRYSSLSYPPAPVSVIKAPSATNEAWIEAHPEYGFDTQTGDIEHLDDARAAYTHALLWYYTGNQANATKAIEIMNAWSSTLTGILFDEPRRPDTNERLYNNGKLQAGWAASLFTRAAEIIRYSNAGWSSTDVSRFEQMLNNIYLPLTITGWSNGANWLMTFAEATMGIGVFTNNRSTFDAGVAYWRDKVPTTIYLPSDGSTPVSPTASMDTAAEINNYWYNPSTYIKGLQGETGRDLGHMVLGLGALANAAETARIQGVDLYGEQRDRIVAAYELNAGFVNQYLDKVASLGGAQPPSSWRPTGWVSPDFNVGGAAYLDGWEIAYNYYVKRAGISMPQTERLVLRARPTGPQLQLCWETLTSAR